MRRVFVALVCSVGTYCCGMGNAFAWANPFNPNPTQEDATIVRTSTTDCPSDPNARPADYTVWVYEHAPYFGRCKVLLPGFYPHSTNFGIPNDSMSSIKIGAGVRARLFEHAEYGGAFMPITSDVSYLGNIFSWNDVVSSMRVELADRSQYCTDVKEGEMALFVDANYSSWNDCVVLPLKTWSGSGRTYNNPAEMGIRNDSISSVMYRSDFNRTGFFWDVNLNHNNAACYTPYPYQYIPSLPSRYGQIIGPNDQISSIGPVANQYVCGRF
jgi:hypothetical protein